MVSTVAAVFIGVSGCGLPAEDNGPEAPLPGSSVAWNSDRGEVESNGQRRSPADPSVTEFGFRGLDAGDVSSGAVERDTGFALDPQPTDDGCSFALDEDNLVGVVTDEDELVLAFVIGSPKYRTYGNIGVGSTIDEVTAQFGADATVLAVTSGTGGPLVRVAPAGPVTETSRGMYLRTNPQRKVTELRVGMWPWVEYDDYCSSSDAQEAAR